MVWLKNILLSLLLMVEMTAFSLPYAGELLDATREPIRSDIVVCLGGGTIERVERSAALIEDGYVSSNRLLLLGESWYNQPALKNRYPDLDVTIDEMPQNTADEIRAIKAYMHQHGYKRALVVTDPPHSARVDVLDMLIEGDEELSLRVVSSEVSWWDKAYYRSEKSSQFVWSESLAVAYSLIAYGIADKLGGLDRFEALVKRNYKEWSRG